MRKRINTTLLKICATWVILLGGSVVVAAAQLPAHAPGRLIVKFKEVFTVVGNKTGIASVDALNKKYGVTAIVLLNKDPRSIEEIKRKYLQRAKRAPVSGQASQPTSMGATYVLEMSATVSIPQAAKEFAKDPAVLYAEPDYIVTIQQ